MSSDETMVVDVATTPKSGRRRGPTHKASSRLILAVYVIASLTYIVICVHLPVQFNLGADKDDGYFIGAARSILDGDWLGPYDQMTLIKGPGFAYFLVLNNLLGTSTTFLLGLIFVAACGVLAVVLRLCLLVPREAALLVFLLLLFQPALMPSRVIRDSLYQSLFLLALAGIIALTLGRGGVRRPLLWAIPGIPMGLFWITREEGIWVLPAFALLVVVRTWQLRRQGRLMLRYGVALLAFGMGAALPVLGTSAVNQSEYGTFTVTDINAAPFQSTLKALDTITAGQEIPHVLVSQRALQLAFDASPSFAELSENLASQDNFWLTPGCSVYPDTCGEFGGGWFGWAVRDAAFEAGHYSSATEASRYFTQIASELDEACVGGELTCQSGFMPVGPVVTSDTIKKLPSTMWKGVRLTSYGEGATLPLISTAGQPEAVADTRSFLGNPFTTSSVELTPVIAPENESRWVRGKELLAAVYSVVTPLLILAGSVSFVTAVLLVVRRRPVRRRLLVVAAACWVLYASRLGLVAIIDITSSPAVTSEYLGSAFLVLNIAATLSVLSLSAAVLSRPFLSLSRRFEAHKAANSVAE